MLPDFPLHTLYTVYCVQYFLRPFLSINEVFQAHSLHQENKKDILSGQAETQSGDSKDEDEETEMKVLQIVAQEIGIDKSAETIKAQCVIARTNLYDAMQAGTKEPESMPPDQQQELWGENFDKNYQKLKSCVEATAGETLLYNKTRKDNLPPWCPHDILP